MRLWRELKNFVHRLNAAPGGAEFRRLSRAAGVGGYKRLYHYHIRKTAGTSLNHALLSIGGEPGDVVYGRLAKDRNHRTISGDKAFVGWVWGLIEQGHYHYAFSHYPAHHLRLPAGTFTMTCLRDPVQRLVSYYSMLWAMRETGSSHGALKLAGPWLGDSLRDFLERAPRSFLSMQLYMFSPRFDVQEAVDGVLACNCVLFTETFADGLGRLGAQIGCALPVLHVRPTQQKPAISAADLERAREMLRGEYAMIEAIRAAKGG